MYVESVGLYRNWILTPDDPHLCNTCNSDNGGYDIAVCDRRKNHNMSDDLDEGNTTTVLGRQFIISMYDRINS